MSHRLSIAPSCARFPRQLMQVAALSTLALPAFAGDSFMDALTGGKPSLDVRYRYESVDQNNALKNADASTLRLRFGYETGEYKGFGVMLEGEHLSAIGDDDYNSTTNKKTTYSIVADPEFTEVNQAYLSFSGLPNTKLKYGRQRILLDNQRFIGNVGWRQNEQTFDAFTVVNKSLPATTITAGYIYNVNRVFSHHSKVPVATFANVGKAKMSSPILNISYKGFSAGEIVGYGYFLDYENFATNSTQTIGLRFKGEKPVFTGYKALYTAEYAQQSDYKSNPASYDVDYYLFEGGLAKGVHSVKLGYEFLEGNGVKSFQTPLATLHAFNGWADVFLATPANGLKDTYLGVGSAVYGVKLDAVYHDYRADRTSARYGTEWNLQATKPIAKKYLVGIKYADYNAKGFAVDTEKVWLWAEAKF
ncbi:MAG: alginate export family protein [Rhodocyclales bacterium]|nr:alginate export family protein [Rhodocyclales bacterium]